MASGVDESGLDPEIRAKLASDSSERLYVYTRATGGWFIHAPPAAGLGLPFDFTHLAITHLAVYWRGWEQRDLTTKGLFGRTRTESTWLQTPASIKVSDIERIVVSREGFDPGFASWPPQQHLSLEVIGRDITQTFYNWATNSADVLRDVAAIFAGLGVRAEDRAGILPA